MIQTYEALLREHVMLQMCNATNTSLKDFVAQLTDQHQQDGNLIADAYEYILSELVGVKKGL